MVRRRVNSSNAVSASGDTTCDGDGELVAVREGVVQTLEERELRVVEGSGGRKGRKRLDDDVRVTNDVACRVDRLRGREVVGLRVHERTRLELVDRDGDREVLVRGDGTKVRWARELRGGHVLLTSNDAHRRWVARTSGDLLAVRDGQVGLGEAEVDEVVR